MGRAIGICDGAWRAIAPNGGKLLRARALCDYCQAEVNGDVRSGKLTVR